ncbi:MAG: prepilin-type N-terminal cleavage/methylation domain-containing protein [Candidatus Gracilibacteria bacterium]|nr:prepilin-type N-terminal cleavage/methylation domain-containing protein [Candidatus Gracilibacteria bacterium]MDD2908139.1 prepilin-type N-terminal cleavage/methylation domain-containing protein [Candidatus Gracilibacteria bacterium]
MPNKAGFSLVEVLISAVILSVTIFGILRLTNNNTNQISIIERNKEIYEIYNDSSECLKSFGTGYLITINTSTQSLNFGDDNTKCLTGSYNSSLDFSGILLKSFVGDEEVRGNEFWNYFTTSTGINYVQVTNYITDGTNTKNFEFKIYK